MVVVSQQLLKSLNWTSPEPPNRSCSNPVRRTPSVPDTADRFYQMACFAPDFRQLGLGFLDHVRLPILGQGFQL